MISDMMMKCADACGRVVWQCLVCQKESHLKADISRHVEALHVQHPGVACEICGKTLKTRDGLRCHMAKFHKDNNFLMF